MTLPKPTPKFNSQIRQTGTQCDESWRSMEPADALAWLVAEDVARRARENPPGMAGPGNRKRLIAWRRANGGPSA